MKNMLRAIMGVGLLVISGGAGAYAQQAQRMVKFAAPFAFEVENNKLPAGEYTVLVQSGWLQIQGKDGKTAAHALTMPMASEGQKTVEKSYVVFHNYHGHFFLAEIWASGQQKGRELLESREEQQLAKREQMVKVNVPEQSAAGK
jgi:hypothetical protein